MKRRRKPAPKAANGAVEYRNLTLKVRTNLLNGVWAEDPGGQLLRYPSLKPFTETDREFGPWVRDAAGRWARERASRPRRR